MRITLNPEEKVIMKKYGRINIRLLCLPKDYFGHYWVETTDEGTFIKAKKRGLETVSRNAKRNQ